MELYGTLKQFRRHLGRHMEQLALFALPIKEGDDLEDDSADEVDGNESESFDDGRAEGHFCDYQKCKHKEAFHRKDHCREHYREYHREDLVRTHQRDVELWLQDRNVVSSWWRCSKCLRRNQTEGGWKCGRDCNQICEKARIVARKSKLEAAESKEETKPLTPATSETAVEKMEVIMLHFRTAILPVCTRFTHAPLTDPKKMDLEFKTLREKIMREVLLKIDGIETEGNSEARQKRLS